MEKDNNPFSVTSKLNDILLRICKDVTMPTMHETSIDNSHLTQSLAEQNEIKTYPYSLLNCPHLEEKQIGEDCLECQQLQYETYKSRFISLVNQHGYENTHTLKAAFDYYSSLITQYRLTECDELLNQIYPYCISRGSWSVYYVSVIQALAFLRFKQARYNESIDFFTQQLNTQGNHDIIYENMALPLARLGQYQEATACYARSIFLIRQNEIDKNRLSTLLISLAAVIENSNDSLILLEEGLRLLRERFDKPHS